MNDFDSKIAGLQEKLKPLYAEREALGEKLLGQKEKEQMKQPMTPVQEMEYFLFEDGSVSGERYKAREKYWRDKGLWNSGYHPDIQQVNLQMMLYKGVQDNLEQTISTVEEVLPLLKVHNGVKRLGIFEHTCSENGNWSVEITDTSYDLILHYYHRKSVNKSFDSLRALVQYVQQYHYYESSVDSNAAYNLAWQHRDQISVHENISILDGVRNSASKLLKENK